MQLPSALNWKLTRLIWRILFLPADIIHTLCTEFLRSVIEPKGIALWIAFAWIIHSAFEQEYLSPELYQHYIAGNLMLTAPLAIGLLLSCIYPPIRHLAILGIAGLGIEMLMRNSNPEWGYSYFNSNAPFKTVLTSGFGLAVFAKLPLINTAWQKLAYPKQPWWRLAPTTQKPALQKIPIITIHKHTHGKKLNRHKITQQLSPQLQQLITQK